MNLPFIKWSNGQIKLRSSVSNTPRPGHRRPDHGLHYAMDTSAAGSRITAAGDVPDVTETRAAASRGKPKSRDFARLCATEARAPDRGNRSRARVSDGACYGRGRRRRFATLRRRRLFATLRRRRLFATPRTGPSRNGTPRDPLQNTLTRARTNFRARKSARQCANRGGG